MGKKLDHEKINELVKSGYSYKEISELLDYNSNSVCGYCWKHFGKLEDRNRSRRQSIELTNDQKEFLFGTLLGDGNLQKTNSSFMGRTNHSIKQYDYCKFKQDIFQNISYPIKTTTKILNGKEYEQCYFCFKPNTELKELYEMFYSSGKKKIPKNLDLLTPKAMALWFMDDGTASGGCSISIATCSFNVDDLIRLKHFLKDKYNLNITIQKDFKIYFSADSARIFLKLTERYIIPEMMYKFKFVSAADLKLR